jgi:hypothetical protein
MRRFRYALDPLCLGACALYALNRWVLKPRIHSAFLHSHFNDLLFIPAALPLVLWLQRRLGLRTSDGPPEAREIALHFVVWSVMAEIVAPHFAHVTGDWRDVLAYAAGALAAWAWWLTVPGRVAERATAPQPR